MKKSIIRLSTLVILSSSVFFSCKKYSEGPEISLVPRKDRVANTWVIEKATENNEDVTSNYRQYELYLTKDGDAELKGDYNFFGVPYTTDTDGTWEFTNDQSNIKLDFEGDTYDAEYQILKLTQNELWLRRVGAEVELHLQEK